MAISKIGSIKTTLSLAVDYILNPEKTENGKYTFSFNCSLDGKTAEEEFLNIRSFGTGKGNVLAKHIKQSFKGNEVTPEQALEIGIKTAEELLGNQYQYIVATHINTDNVHNHIIFNNINFDNYRSFEWLENRGKNSWEKLRKINDKICEEYDLSVINNPKKPGKCYYEWQQDYMGKSWKSKLRTLIDETIMQSDSFDDFLSKLKYKNISYVYTPENVIKIKFRLQGQERYSRGKTLGWYYDEPQLRKRIEQYNLIKNGISGRTYNTKIIDTSKGVFRSSKGLLNWAELQNMKEASRILNFLTTNNLSSQDELNNSATVQYNERMVLVSKLNKTQNKINEISDVIRLIRTYNKYKSVHSNLLTIKSSRAKEKYKKENITALKKYDDAVKGLAQLYPNHKVPSLQNLESEKSELIKQVAVMNEQYKETVKKLKEIEFAQQTINDYLRTSEKSRNQHLE